MKKATLASFLVAVGSNFGVASAQTPACSLGTIAVYISPNSNGSCSVTSAGSGKYNVSVTRPTDTQTVSVDVVGTTSDNLHFVTISTSSAWPTWLTVGSVGQEFQTIESVTRTGAGAGEVVLLDLATTGHLGINLSSTPSIELDKINTVNVGGDILSPVTASTNNIQTLNVTGSLYGHVTATNGSISLIDCGGNMSTVNIRAKTGIDHLKCATCYASIDTKWNSGSGNLGYLETTSGGFLTSGGYGSLNTNSIDRSTSPSGLSIAGSLLAPLTISGSVNEPITVTGDVDALVDVTGSLSSGTTFKIGQSLVSGTGHGEIRVGSSGLVGQIIINAGGATSNAWGGPVKVNGTTISGAPYYTATSSSLGGGSVGQAVYHLHDEDCVPANGYSGSAPGDDIVRLHWYGPLSWDGNPSHAPATVEWQSGGVWIDITGSFDFTISGSNARELQVKPKPTSPDWGNHKYRIKPTSYLNCDGVTNTPDVDQSDVYEVTF